MNDACFPAPLRPFQMPFIENLDVEPAAACRLVGCAPEDRLHLDAASCTAPRPLGGDGAGLDEELGSDSGQGKHGSPQSTSSPGVAVGCLFVRRVRSSRIPRSNEISTLDAPCIPVKRVRSAPARFEPKLRSGLFVHAF